MKIGSNAHARGGVKQRPLSEQTAMIHLMRPEVWQVVTRTGPVVLVTGDTGTGKSSVIQATTEQYPNTFVAPPVAVCMFDSGALQAAMFEVLATALATAQPGQVKWRDLAKRLRHATREAAIEVGKALADAVIEEVVELAKARLGENAGQGLLKFYKAVKKDGSADLRRTLRTQTDSNVVRLLMRTGEEVAAVAGRDIVITLDEGNRLSDDDQRILASIAAQPAKRIRIVIAWSTAEVDSLPGLTRLRKLGLEEIPVSGLSYDDVKQWLTTERLAAHADDIYALTAGYPLLVESLVAHLQSGDVLDRYSAPTLFNDVLHDALNRLPVDANHAARKLSAFAYPLPEEDIPGFLGLEPIAWGAIRNALERERVFSVAYPGRTWFHEARRSYLWSEVLTEPERDQVGQQAYSKLVEQQRNNDMPYAGGLFRQIAALASHARESQVQNPNLTAVLNLNADHLAVLAAAIELENIKPNLSTPADQVVIHAHTAFGADRRKALEALPDLDSLGVIRLHEISHEEPGQTESRVDLLLDYECSVVARGRIQASLGKTAVPQLTDHVVRAHLERVRQESYAIITEAGHADAMGVIANANLVRPPTQLKRVGDPLVGVWLRYGDQPVTVVGVFNNNADRASAEREIANLAGASFGRRLVVDRTFRDPTSTIASLRFIYAIYYATGLRVHTNGSEYGLEITNALPMEEFAQRQVDLLGLLRSETDELEREVYDLTVPAGVAIARRDKTEYRLGIQGAAHVYPMDFDEIESILTRGSQVHARMELALNLPPNITTKHLTTQTWPDERTQDPVVELLGTLRKQAAEFNARQPRTVVHLEKRRLQRQLTTAHMRGQQLARRMSETITIGGERGVRPSRALRLVIHTHGPRNRPTQRAAICALPPGDPSDVQIRYVSDTSVENAEAAYKAAFGADADTTDLHAAMLPEMLALLLGFADNEIEVIG
ncbi:AAA family ATPase [Mycobacteroides abscessus]|uniref:AAA family ATPase n=1 Tax=Mycobacteroides abscessus TaxID=36809 RepID=UPI0013001670|nr:AAA family ATPase [Mycobacteroides abscessus]